MSWGIIVFFFIVTPFIGFVILANSRKVNEILSNINPGEQRSFINRNVFINIFEILKALKNSKGLAEEERRILLRIMILEVIFFMLWISWAFLVFFGNW
jgi:hypothetical protein